MIELKETSLIYLMCKQGDYQVALQGEGFTAYEIKAQSEYLIVRESNGNTAQNLMYPAIIANVNEHLGLGFAEKDWNVTIQCESNQGEEIIPEHAHLKLVELASRDATIANPLAEQGIKAPAS